MEEQLKQQNTEKASSYQTYVQDDTQDAQKDTEDTQNNTQGILNDIQDNQNDTQNGSISEQEQSGLARNEESKLVTTAKESYQTYKNGHALVKRTKDTIGIIGAIKLRAILCIVFLVLTLASIIGTVVFCTYWKHTEIECPVSDLIDQNKKLDSTQNEGAKDDKIAPSDAETPKQENNGKLGGMLDSAKNYAKEKADNAIETAGETIDQAKDFALKKLDNPPPNNE